MPSLLTLSSPFSWLLLLRICHMMWNIPLGSLGQLSWLCPVPRSCPPSAYWWEGTVGDTPVMLSQQTPTCYQLLSSTEHSTEGCSGENWLHLSQTHGPKRHTNVGRQQLPQPVDFPEQVGKLCVRKSANPVICTGLSAQEFSVSCLVP